MRSIGGLVKMDAREVRLAMAVALDVKADEVRPVELSFSTCGLVGSSAMFHTHRHTHRQTHTHTHTHT